MTRRPGVLDPAESEDFVSALYLAMIRLGTPTVEALVGEGYDEEDVRRGARVLTDRGLVGPVGAAAWEVRPPEVALPRLAATLEARAQMTRASATELGVLWRRARRAGPEPVATGLETLESVVDTVQYMQAARSQARDQLCALLDDSPATRDFLLAVADGDSGPGPPTAIVVVDVNLLQDSEVLGALERYAAAGASVSVVPHVPFGAVVADDTFAVIDLTHYAPEGAVSFVVRRSPAISALSALVSTAHRLATPLRPTSDDPRLPLTSRDQRIMALLATGATDQVIARHLQLSTRTVERRVRTLMDSLGAATRFQAGVLAARRGWL